MPSRLSLVVPTAGQSPYLEACLRALRGDAGDDAEILLAVAPDVAIESAVATAAELCDRVVEVPAGFAAANNHAFAEAEGDYLGTVNDDALVAPGWCRALVEFLDRRPGVAAVQGLVLAMDSSERNPRLDGAGVGWNRWLQAVQLGHNERCPAQQVPRPIFGVSATAAIYRREALARLQEREVGSRSSQVSGPFDTSLFAYYEDVDLALRLRAAGEQAWLVPEARVRHVGSSTGRRLRWGGKALIHGNRHLVLARRLAGVDYLMHWPRTLARDLLDAVHHARHGELAAAAGVMIGLGRALPRLPFRLLGVGGRLKAQELLRLPSTLDELMR